MFNFKKIPMNVIQRVKSPTPKFFRLLRIIGLALAATSGVILTSPVELPEVVIKAAGYLTVAGGVIAAVSQTAVEREGDEPEDGGTV
jgi:hypothetical protein